MTRPTNPELCAEFRRLLTDGARGAMNEVAALHPVSADDLLGDTRAWRSDLWRIFREIEKRMCPQPGDFNGDDDDGE